MENWLKFKRKIEVELRKEFRIRVVVGETIKYFKIPRERLLGNSQNSTVTYMRNLICYVGFTVYGIKYKVIAKHVKRSMSVVRRGNQAIKSLIILMDARTMSDVENIRRRVVEQLTNVKDI